MANYSEANIRDLTLIVLWHICSARLAFLGKLHFRVLVCYKIHKSISLLTANTRTARVACRVISLIMENPSVLDSEYLLVSLEHIIAAAASPSLDLRREKYKVVAENTP